MTIWAIGDLHLSFSDPAKNMEKINPHWEGHIDKIAQSWKDSVKADDLVLLPGDISWAMRWPDALHDLEWIDRLPGQKVMIKGNHDHWWPSQAKLQRDLPSSIVALYQSAFSWRGLAIGGSRLWDSPSFSFVEYIDWAGEREPQQQERTSLLFERELIRLRRSLEGLDPHAHHRLVMTHYPPLGPDHAPSPVTDLFEEFDIEVALFGHLHNLKASTPPFGSVRGITYHCVASDYLGFALKKIPIGEE
ncbi:MAG: metallophosphoesterase [Chlamydiota bacterium]|nr:metallophosphoesterase [Chlamydiota bacterium]